MDSKEKIVDGISAFNHAMDIYRNCLSNTENIHSTMLDYYINIPPIRSYTCKIKITGITTMNIPTTYPPYTLYEELPEPIFLEMKEKEAEKIKQEELKNV